MSLARIAVAWSGGLISFFGVLYLVNTVRMLAFSELTGLSPTALTDARVMYGAFEFGAGIFSLRWWSRRSFGATIRPAWT